MANNTSVPMLFMPNTKPPVSYNTNTLQSLLNDVQAITDNQKIALHISTDFHDVSDSKVSRDVQDVCFNMEPNLLFKTPSETTDKMNVSPSRESLSVIFDRNSELALASEEDIALTHVEDPQNIFLDTCPTTFNLSNLIYRSEDSSKTLTRSVTQLPSEFKVLPYTVKTMTSPTTSLAGGSVLSFLNLFQPTKIITTTTNHSSVTVLPVPKISPDVIKVTESVEATTASSEVDLTDMNKTNCEILEDGYDNAFNDNIILENDSEKNTVIDCDQESSCYHFELKENWKKLFCEIFDSYNGYVKDLKTAEALIKEYESNTDSKFCVWNSPKNFGETEINSKTPRKIMVNQTMFPYIVLCTKRFECEYGKDRHKNAKLQKMEKNGAKESKMLTKKTNCGAAICLREVLIFPELQIKRGSHWERRLASKKIRAWLADEISEPVKYERYILITLPKIQDHTNHLETLPKESILPEILQEAYQLVWENEDVYVEDLRDKLYNFVVKNYFSGKLPDGKRRRFFPTLSDLRYIATRAKRIRIVTNDEKRKTKLLVDNLRNKHLFDRFFICDDINNILNTDAGNTRSLAGRYFLRIKNRPSKLIYMYQSAKSQALLFRYGHQTLFTMLPQSLVSVPFQIYCLYVCTNVDFQPVAVIICENANKDIFTDVIERLKEWNKFWSPKFVQTNKDEDQIEAFESAFTDCSVFVNRHSREKDWLSWFRERNNELDFNTEEMFKLLEDISNTCSEESFNEAFARVEEKDEWQKCAKFRSWFSSSWLADIKRWVEGYHPNDFITRTLHSQKQDDFFEFFRTSAGKRSNTCLVDFIKRIMEVFQRCYKSYIEHNIDSFDKQSNTAMDSPTLTSEVMEYIQNNKTEAENFKGTIGMIEFGLYQVKAIEADVYNIVAFGNATNFPSCNCSQWQQYRLPCKHMCFIFIHVDEWSFDRLPVHYRFNPLYTVDFNCIPHGVRTRTEFHSLSKSSEVNRNSTVNGGHHTVVSRDVHKAKARKRKHTDTDQSTAVSDVKEKP